MSRGQFKIGYGARIIDRCVLLRTNIHCRPGVEDRSGRSDKIALCGRIERSGYINGIDRRCIVGVADQNILTTVENGVSANQHLPVAVEIIFDIAGDIDRQIASNGDGIAVTGHI